MSTYMDFIQCTVVHSTRMMCTVFDCTLDAFVFVLVHHILTTFVRDDISMNRKPTIIPEKVSIQ